MQAAYHRSYAQPVPPGRRGGPMAPSPHQNRRADTAHNMAPPAMHPQAPGAVAPQEAVKRRASKPTDKTIPDGVEDNVIGDGVQRYKDLRDFERRLDATMTRKRLDVVDAVDRHPKRYKTMRIWITNTVEDQPWQANALTSESFDFSSGLEATYRVKIEGRLLDDDDDDNDEDDEADGKDKDPDRMDTDNAAPAKRPGLLPAQKSRFSHFFKALTVDYDQRKTQNGTELTVEWKKPELAQKASPTNLPAAADFDEFTFKRNGDENTNITINLFRHEEPELYELSPVLADVVDMKEGSRAEIVMALWEYIKVMGLQEDEEKRNFRCDEPLRKLIGRDLGIIPGLENYITQHLKPLAPLKLTYTIRTDESFAKDPQPTIYDVRVAVHSSLRDQLREFSTSTKYAELLKKVAGLDDELAVLVAAVGQSKAKHAFFTGLSRDPTNFVRTWLSSQKRDLDIIMGEATRGAGEAATGDEWRMGGRGSVWGTQNARESVNVLLSKQPPGPR